MHFLRTSGPQIVDDNGHAVHLRGINLGGWLLVERWIPEIDRERDDALNIGDELTLWRVLAERFGADGMARVREAYREHWITERDFARIAALGMNLARVPFNYRLLEEPDGFKWLDRAVEWGKAHGVYVLLDMHAAPGGQSEAEHAGERGSNRLFHDEGDLRRTVQLWREIAARYADEPAVCGYNLLNEPWGAPSPEALCDLYHRCIVAIREVDPRHMIWLDEGYKGLFNLPEPSRYGWDNIVYCMHFYLGASGPDDHRVYTDRFFPYLKALQARHDVPYYFGEFNTMTPEKGGWQGMAHYFAAMNGYGWAWSPWTYKRVSPQPPFDCWGLYRIQGNWDPPLVREDSLEALVAKMARYDTANFALDEPHAEQIRLHCGPNAISRSDVRTAAHLPDHAATMRHRLTRAELDHLLEFLPALAEASGDDLKHVLYGEVFAFADAAQLPKAVVRLIESEWGSLAAFNTIWYCVWASHFAMKSCDFYWSETREGHDERLGIPTAMHPDNFPLLIAYSPRFREATRHFAM